MEKTLVNQEDNSHSLNHVGLIPDGLRRWARENNCSYLDSYQRAMNLLASFVRLMFSQRISSVSLYLLSKDNLKRDIEDLEPVIASEVRLLKDLFPPIVNQFKAKVIHAGKISILPEPYVKAISELCNLTLKNTHHRLYLLIGYDPLDELEVALQKSSNHHVLFQNLWVPEKLDLVIRTGSEYRLSNFLPLQAVYAEFIFEKKYFNSINEKDMQDFLRKYLARHRRFGL